MNKLELVVKEDIKYLQNLLNEKRGCMSPIIGLVPYEYNRKTGQYARYSLTVLSDGVEKEIAYGTIFEINCAVKALAKFLEV